MRRFPARPLAIALVLATSVVALPARADAPPVTEDGAKALAAAIKDGLARWFPKPTDGGTEMRWKGEPKATPAGDHYDVALPPLTVVNDDGSTAEVASVALTVKPLEGGTHAVTAVLPDTVPLLDGGKPSATIRIGQQRFSGVWSGAYESFLSVDANYGDLSVTSDKKSGGKKGDAKNGSLTIGSVTMAGELKPDGATTWSGPGALSINNVRFLDDQKKEVMTLAGLTAEGTYTRVDLARSSAMQRLLQAHAAAGTEPPPAELIPLVQGMMGGGSFRFGLSGLSGRNPDDGSRFALAQFAARGATEDFDKPSASATMGFELSGLDIAPPVAPQGFLPDRMELQLSLAKLPTASLWQALGDYAALAQAQDLDDEDEDEDDEEAAAPDPQAEAIGNRLVGAMAAVGSELRIDKLAVNAPAASGDMTGAVRMAANTAYGAVGGATILLRGLDAAAKAMQPKPGKKADKESQDALGVIAMLQAFGQTGKDASGNEVRSYKIDLTDSGQILLNGADMSALMGGGAPTEPAPTDKKAPKKL
ncbi:hypothetical protein [Azospirillum rugosum]|uniref:DUF945 domain-containing protein n=1 Tax=Azospirillum rugosum TaxID=416170 RepID=A0ABS4ST15_9PROT|nr:hypothetical protein [Azospirillum rugosum]MBP2295710.1 hypothetical protein [Azospirillum rugosum]MDQ0526773.1 hypothetical protein [Azospirillum rugosum]